MYLRKRGRNAYRDTEKPPERPGGNRTGVTYFLMNMTDQAETEQKGFRTIRTPGNGQGPRI